MSSEPQEFRERPEETGPRTGRNLLLLIITALMLWAACVACGALLYSSDENPTGGTPRGPMKAVIVVSCVAAFLALWATVLRRPQQPNGLRSVADNRVGSAAPGLSWFGLASPMMQLLAFGPWLVWHFGEQVSAGQLRALFGGSLMSTGIALVLAVIGLSDPAARRGKLWGLVTILLAALLVASWLLIRPE